MHLLVSTKVHMGHREAKRRLLSQIRVQILFDWIGLACATVLDAGVISSEHISLWNWTSLLNHITYAVEYNPLVTWNP